jgi:hypothetical protein
MGQLETLVPFIVFHSPRQHSPLFSKLLAMCNLNQSLAIREKFFQGFTRIVWLAFLLIASLPAVAETKEEQITAIKNEMNDAIFKVQDIVNQPVTHLKRTPDMDVSEYGPGGWFHPGAIKPDFNTVDVRKTQQLDYEGHQYVTSDVNPGVVFLGSELEFNSMTKYFYTDRSVPKKKLTEAEMLQINDLYRTIGKCEAQLDELQNPKPLWTPALAYIVTHKPLCVAVIAVLFVGLIMMRAKRARTESF